MSMRGINHRENIIGALYIKPRSAANIFSARFDGGAQASAKNENRIRVSAGVAWKRGNDTQCGKLAAAKNNSVSKYQIAP